MPVYSIFPFNLSSPPPCSRFGCISIVCHSCSSCDIIFEPSGFKVDGDNQRRSFYYPSPDGQVVPKSELDWIDAEEQASARNSKALNAIFNGVDLNVFKLIKSCNSTIEAWRILEVAYEGKIKVKISRLQLVTSKFEALNMSEEENVADYNERVLEIVK
ncbi:gag-pol polyprotein [Cucumis melo var. makuwa]|uniref:Gag-pol polyprotein n=1 Tax=Cucumis melo var. makuwa TaxID=1194695 RepID=A0A5A7TCR7_CUCMM|nr:gag-pol polyprotein [Cucumis melo var. makuwa]TYK10623.1 gag-pol polyprotein [Cucumis melo var. makuwa]